MIHSFKLHSFRVQQLFTLECELKETNSLIEINYHIQGKDNILWPKESERIERLDNLWTSTCFEFFIGSKNHESYYEYNFSPNGNWQCYHFSSYRSKPSLPKVSGPDISLRRVRFETPLKLADSEFNITCIVKDTSERLHYFALEHPLNGADFHDRKTFTSL